MHEFTRRKLLRTAAVGGAAAMMAPWVGASSNRSEVDVVVIGAGAAGLMATETLVAGGHGVLLLEASGRSGGRVHSDSRHFGQSYDLGAHWLHRAGRNPFVSYAKKQPGFEVYPAPETEILYVGDRLATDDEERTYDRAYDAAVAAIANAGKKGRDVSPAEVVPDLGDWQDTVHQAVGPFEMGKDFSRFSCVDWWNSESGRDWFCRQGFGPLLQHRFRDLPVQLNTAVSAVDWSGSGVVITTNRGDIRARACIVTVSNGVLASGAIRFKPELPDKKQQAFQRISMGHYNHLGLQFSKNFFGIGADGYLTYHIDSANAASPRGMGMLVNISGSDLSYGDVGGEFARELEAEGVEGGIAFALAELRKIFGKDVDRYFVRGHATRWSSDPLFLGAYASAEPGAYSYRKELRRSVGDRLFFAGEACSKDEWATVHGAYKTGKKAAESVGALLASKA